MFKTVRNFIIRKIFSSLPLKRQIVFESHPDLSCNSFELFRYMLSIGLNKKYKMIWLVEDPSLYKHFKEENVSFYYLFPKTLPKKIGRFFLVAQSAAVIYCNRLIGKKYSVPKQLNIYLDHGSPLKSMLKDGKLVCLDCDYIVSQAKFFNKYLLQEYTVTEKQIVCAGVPRNDQLFKNMDISSIYSDIGVYSKKIIWVPTFRKIKNNFRTDCDSQQPFGVPLIKNDDDLIALDLMLKKLNILLVLKPHPAQDLSSIKSVKLKNVRFLTNEQMLEAGIQTNELLSQMDAMITDYSGIYYDYLLLNRPIAITLDDFLEYKNQKGFVIENPLDILKGEHLYKMNDLLSFINEVAEGKDIYLEERKRIKKITNEFDDGCSAKRVCDFIISKVQV